MNNYNSLEEALFDLEKDVSEEISKEIIEEIKETYRNESEQSYGVYTPKSENVSRFRMGMSGSLADIDTFHEEINREGNTININVYSDRKSDCDCGYCDNNDTYLMYYADEGMAGESHITPKNITETAQNQIDEKAYEIIDKALNKRGW